MTFISLQYIALLLVTFVITHSTKNKRRWLIWLIANVIFYGVAGWDVLLLFFCTIVFFFAAGLAIDSAKTSSCKKFILCAAVIGGLAPLLFFKYAKDLYFALPVKHEAYEPAFDVFSHLILPLGISFYVFQLIGYVAGVYRNTAPAIRHFGHFAAYASFFPQLMAGPIGRSEVLVPQIIHPKAFNEQDATSGLSLILWGFFKKLVIADRIGIIIDPIFQNPSSYGGWHTIIAATLFTFQLYCDFSGYIDIGRGGARMLGITLAVNFDRPYLACSVRDFWRRWNITLSQWFRDYVYIPLGGGKTNSVILLRNILITFGLSGLWHGTGPTFALWGVAHGLMVFFEHIIERKKRRASASCATMPLFIRRLLTFGFISASMLLFRCETIEDFATLVGHLPSGKWHAFEQWLKGIHVANHLIIVVIGIVFLIIMEMDQVRNVLRRIEKQPSALPWIAMTVLLATITSVGVFEQQPFLYFRF